MNTQLEHITYTKRYRVAYVTLDRPDVLNALNNKMHEELKTVWDDVAADPDIWVAVLSGKGDRAFSVGQDLNELKERYRMGVGPTTTGSRGGAGFPRLTERGDLSKPIVASVDGYAFGGGFELALACDVIIASERSEFALPEAKLGLIPGAGGIFRLTRQLPLKTALGLMLTGDRIRADRAFSLGLINEVVPADQLEKAVQRWVRAILACSPLATQAIKEIATRSSHLPMDEAFKEVYPAEARRLASDHWIEGPLAFLEKRPPQWTQGHHGESET